jgi:hypothetical protein
MVEPIYVSVEDFRFHIFRSPRHCGRYPVIGIEIGKPHCFRLHLHTIRTLAHPPPQKKKNNDDDDDWEPSPTDGIASHKDPKMPTTVTEEICLLKRDRPKGAATALDETCCHHAIIAVLVIQKKTGLSRTHRLIAQVCCIKCMRVSRKLKKQAD